MLQHKKLFLPTNHTGENNELYSYNKCTNSNDDNDDDDSVDNDDNIRDYHKRRRH